MQTEIFLAERIRDEIKENLVYDLIEEPKTAEEIVNEVKKEKGIIFR